MNVWPFETPDRRLARLADPLTSHEAGQASREFAGRHLGLILTALEQGPAGKTEIARRTGLTGVACARRLPEMQRRGLVEPTGRTVPSDTGRSEREWRAA